MDAIRGTWKNGCIVLDVPVDWPEGCRVSIEPISQGEQTLGIREQDWPTDPRGIAELIRRMELIEPLEMTPEEEADLRAWQQKVKEYTIANMDKGIEGLFE